MFLESAPCTPKSDNLRTVEPVAIINTSYLNVSPAALISVFEATSASTISVLRINEIPENMYHSGSSLSPPLPTHTWKPGSLAAPGGKRYPLLRAGRSYGATCNNNKNNNAL
nr:hypothetical protein Iba_chr10aCG1070 [Ipomoea batatas]